MLDLDLEGIMMKRLHAPLRRQEVMKLEKGAFEKIIIPVKKTKQKKQFITSVKITDLGTTGGNLPGARPRHN